MERTLEACTMIDARGVDSGGVAWVRYRRDDGRRWVIRGTCICCGECEQGIDPRRPVVWRGPAGTPFACIEIGFEKPGRLDCVVTPDLMAKCPSCTLSGEWLDGE